MPVAYDKYYQTENLFGNPYEELISYFSDNPKRGTLLDLGCGQGRDAIPLAKLGYQVTGIDHSKIGIEQMMKISQKDNLKITGVVMDIYEFDDYHEYEFILLDSMLHFMKNDKKRETELVIKIIEQSQAGTLVVFCLPNKKKKIQGLHECLEYCGVIQSKKEVKFSYEYTDGTHKSSTVYKMITVRT